MSIVDSVRKLCTPAYVYLMISIVAIIALMFQNAGNTDRYCIGVYECRVDNTAMMFLGKGLYVLFWTYVLNAICRAGYKGISWFLVLFPFLLFFVLLGMLMVLTIQEPYTPIPGVQMKEPYTPIPGVPMKEPYSLVPGMTL